MKDKDWLKGKTITYKDEEEVPKWVLEELKRLKEQIEEKQDK